MGFLPRYSWHKQWRNVYNIVVHKNMKPHAGVKTKAHYYIPLYEDEVEKEERF